jgi:hypothetical protein
MPLRQPGALQASLKTLSFAPRHQQQIALIEGEIFATSLFPTIQFQEIGNTFMPEAIIEPILHTII